MASFKVHGPYRPGFKRFTADQFGNDCMLFYPVSKSINPTAFSPYRDVEQTLKYMGPAGQGASGKAAMRFRLVQNCAPEGPLDPIFTNG
jgi:hypothetical protein